MYKEWDPLDILKRGSLTALPFAPTEGFSLRSRYLSSYLVLACISESGIAALYAAYIYWRWCQPPKHIIKQDCLLKNQVSRRNL